MRKKASHHSLWGVSDHHKFTRAHKTPPVPHTCRLWNLPARVYFFHPPCCSEAPKLLSFFGIRHKKHQIFRALRSLPRLEVLLNHAALINDVDVVNVVTPVRHAEINETLGDERKMLCTLLSSSFFRRRCKFRRRPQSKQRSHSLSRPWVLHFRTGRSGVPRTRSGSCWSRSCPSGWSRPSWTWRQQRRCRRHRGRRGLG